MLADPQRDDCSPSLDHVTPRSKGGTHHPSNLLTANRWCNAVLSDGTYYSEHDLAA
ncbi:MULTISPECIES: HNH endonuclease [Paenarthrobacter]|uniref:HNH endonuclease n=1 Tax=Paenarthrobacter TaxID=1742992 RepID=UPI003977CCBE